jgi:hypothetical protein
MTDRARNNARKTPKGRPFAKGNPGRPKGARHKTTVLLEKIMADDAAAVMKTVVEAAKGGDMRAAAIIVERMAPPAPKDRPIQFTLPPITTIDDAAEALAGLLKSVANGEITPNEAASVAGLIEGFRKSVETLEHEARIRSLEQARDARQP